MSPYSLNHELHLWPVNKKLRVVKCNLKSAKVRFDRGLRFTTGSNVVTKDDLPEGTRVCIHQKTARLTIVVQ